MSFFPKTKSPAYLAVGAVLLFMGMINFAGEKGTVTPHAIMFNTIYTVVGVTMIIGSRMIFFRPREETGKKKR